MKDKARAQLREQRIAEWAQTLSQSDNELSYDRVLFLVRHMAGLMLDVPKYSQARASADLDKALVLARRLSGYAEQLESTLKLQRQEALDREQRGR